MKDQLFKPLTVNGKKYITSHLLHRDVHPTGSLSDTNRSIRRAKTFPQLVDNKHVLELCMQHPEIIRDANLALLIKSNSYKPVMLIDPVAQKAIEHHFKETAVQAVHSSKENAVLSMAGIDLEALASNPQNMMLLKALIESEKVKQEVKQVRIESKEVKDKVDAVADKLSLMDGDTGYETIVAFARKNRVRLPLKLSKNLGTRAAEFCHREGFPLGRVPDERWGSVNSYPRDILSELFTREGLTA